MRSFTERAAAANAIVYNEELTRNYVASAPHLAHRALRELYLAHVERAYGLAGVGEREPDVLDLGAGDGSATLPFLALGAKVTAVDISPSQLRELQQKCAPYADRLEVRCEDIADTLNGLKKQFDIVVMNSFVHHVPDYLAAIVGAVGRLRRRGVFFCFQDPIRYDTLGPFTFAFSRISYFWWRIFQGNLLQGLNTRLRRIRGVYLEDNPADNAEYHVVRNGVDQEAICQLLQASGFNCDVVRYFSTQSRVFQILGTALRLKTQFGILAYRID